LLVDVIAHRKVQKGT